VDVLISPTCHGYSFTSVTFPPTILLTLLATPQEHLLLDVVVIGAAVGGAAVSSVGGAAVSPVGGAGVSPVGGAGVSAVGGAGVSAVGGAAVSPVGGAGVSPVGGAAVSSVVVAGVPSQKTWHWNPVPCPLLLE